MIHSRWLSVIISFCFCLLICSKPVLSEGNNFIGSKIEDIPKDAWQCLAEKNIYFGHQSVGYNIIAGVHSILKLYPFIDMEIVEISETDKLDAPVFAHSLIGENENPVSKIKHFAKIMESGIASNVEYAFFKFCYIDIDKETDIESLFQEYQKTMQRLEQKYPDVTFVHVTVPLRTIQKGPKAWIKKMLGKTIGGYDDNMKRAEFSQFLNQRYDNNHIFDLASLEATSLDGQKCSFSVAGKTYPCLQPAFTNDNGHLNQLGQKVAGAALLNFLARLSNSKK